jgi:hypothetical protein
MNTSALEFVGEGSVLRLQHVAQALLRVGIVVDHTSATWRWRSPASLAGIAATPAGAAPRAAAPPAPHRGVVPGQSTQRNTSTR